jgi:hypothetical protein
MDLMLDVVREKERARSTQLPHGTRLHGNTASHSRIAHSVA